VKKGLALGHDIVRYKTRRAQPAQFRLWMAITYLVSGANRGIGLGIVRHLSERPDTIVFAGARHPDGATELKELVDLKPSVVHIVKLTSGNAEDNAAAVEMIKQVAGRLDVVVANAGISKSYTTGVFDTPISDLREHWEVNTGGPHILFQQTLPLLRASPRDISNPPKFIVISSAAASLGLAEQFDATTAYRSSKAAVNFLTRAMHFEHEKDGLVAFSLTPGPAATDLFHEVVRRVGGNLAKFTPISVDTSVAGILKVIHGATRSTHGGKFINYEGKEIEW